MDTDKYKQLEEQYNAATDEKERIDLLIEMALEERNLDVDAAFAMSDQIIERANKIGYRKGQGRGLNLQGWCYWQQGNYDAGLDTLKEARTTAREIKDKPLEARVLNNFGYIYRDKGELSTALNYFENALSINEKLGDEVSQAVNLSSIAYINYDLNDYENALEYALKCLPIFKAAEDKHRLTSLYHILGNIYFKQEQFEEALNYFAQNLEQTEPDTAVHAMAINGMGKVFYKMKHFEEAVDYLKEALKLAEENNNVEVQISCHYYIGRIFLDEDNFRKAQQHLTTALNMAEQYSRRHDLMGVHEMLATLYDKMGDIPKAFHHLKTFEELKEDIFKQATINQLHNLQIRQQTELAQKEKEVAERTADLKQQFMANMSHEIRTPMNAIVGMTRLLLDKEPRAEQMRYLSAIQQSADNLLVIINDILDLSKIESGKIVLEETDFSIKELLESMRDMLMLKAEEKGIELKIDIDKELPRRLNGDPTRLNQILINLTGNAIKFTEHGAVSVTVKPVKTEGGKVWVQFDVTDTGIGISKDYIDKIFDSFTQAGSDVARKFGGTGLGLTISKQLVSLMQGEITVTSEQGKGTTFTVLVPMDEARQQEQCEKNKTIDEATIKQLNIIKVLLAEDNEFNRMVAEDTLKELLPGIKIDIAVNGEEAVKKVQQTNYDLVLMDIQMPVMDGVTATKNIRNLNTQHKDVNIIAMTANVLQEDVQQYLKAGMNAYISKPFNPDELLMKMAEVIQKEQQAPAEEITQMKPLRALPGHVIDMQFLKQFTGGNMEKMKKYVGMFLDNAPRLLANMQRALAEKDFGGIKIAAHSMKPQLSYMGVKEEVSHIFLIEQAAGEPAHQEQLPQLVLELQQLCTKAFEELTIVLAE